MQRGRWWLACALVLVAGFLCATGGRSLGAASSGAPFKVGVILGVTGATGNLGQHELDGARLAAAAINGTGGVSGHPLELVFEDDAGVPDNAVNAFNHITSDPAVLAIFGSTLGTNTDAILPLAQRVGISVLAPNSTYDITHHGNPWVFRIAVPANVEVDALTALLKERGLTRIAVLNSTDAYGSQGAALIARQAGLTIVAHESFPLTASDVTVQLTKIRTANAQALVLWGSAPLVGVALRNAAQLGMTMPIFSGLAADNPGNIKAAANAATLAQWLVEGVLDPAHPLPRQREGLAAIRGRYGYDPDVFAAIGWDAMFVLARALGKAGTVPTRESVRTAMTTISNFPGLAGVYTWTSTYRDGTGISSLIWLAVRDGVFVRAF